MPPEHPVVQTSIKAARLAYGREPVAWPLLEGSGSMHMFPDVLGTPLFTIGLGQPSSQANTHAPNEHISIPYYLSGIKMMATLFHLCGN